MKRDGALYRINRAYDRLEEPLRFFLGLAIIIALMTVTLVPGIMTDHEQLGAVAMVVLSLNVMYVRLRYLNS